MVAAPPHTEPPTGNIRLIVQHDQGALRLRWSPKAPAIRDAERGTLTITDGAHQSKLELDGRELRAGLASYWPEGSQVSFRLETNSGASGAIDAPGIAEPAKPQAEAKTEAVTAVTKAPAAPRRRPKTTASSYREPIDDGLEWTEKPRRDSRWSKLKQKIPFWRKPAADDR